MNKQHLVDRLMTKGFSLLDSHHYRDALACGRKLKRLRHSSAFEIMALAYLRLERLPKAIAILEEGVAKASRAWLIWELLGNCYSDAARYKDAEKAYQTALLQVNCDPHVIHLNRAIAFERAGKLKQARSAIEKVDSPRLSQMADEVRIRLYHAFGRKAQASRLALKLCTRRISAVELTPQRESYMLTTCAMALKDAPKTRHKARSLAYRAAGLNPANTQALSLVRELDAYHSAGASLFKLLVQGVWNEPFGKSKTPPGFFNSCQVYAQDQPTAFRYATKFFPRAVRSSLTVEESRILPCDQLALDGVYFLSSLMFYPRRRSQKPRKPT